MPTPHLISTYQLISMLQVEMITKTIEHLVTCENHEDNLLLAIIIEDCRRPRF